MAKKKGMFSWFSRKSEKKSEQEAQEEKVVANEQQSAADEAERLAVEEAARLEQERLAAEEAARLEQERLAAEEAARLEQERLAAEEAARLEQERLAAEEAARLEQERLAAEEAARLEQERLAAEEAARIEQERLAAEEAARLEQERLAAEEAARLEQERLAEEAEKQEQERLDAEQAEQEKLEKQQSEAKNEEKLGFFARFARRLKKTRLNIGSGLLSLFKGKQIDDELFEELEEQLIVADIGVETTTRIIDNLTDHADSKELKDAELLYDLLKRDLSDILQKVEKPLQIDETKRPYVILMVGVNGVGKTTTIGKLAKKFQNNGKSVMLAAGDTFRAAAVEQLQVWGERNNIPVIAQQTGADSASVLFDAMDAATARGVDVLIADTAGRLQNKDHLMTELAKVVRIMRKKDASAPHEIMLTIDAGTGQNAMSQVKLFHEAVGLTGITFTKLDGTAKGGIIFSIADKYQLPIRYLGVGEGVDDLREFNAKEFIDALFSKEDESEKGGNVG